MVGRGAFWKKLLGRQSTGDIRDLFELIARANGFQGENKAQFHQDIFALLESGFKRNGYFVEFGATNGVDLSNTYLLEKVFGWRGILAEPATVWHTELNANRTAAIEFDCVWKNSGESLTFNMVDEAELSTLAAFNNSDGRSGKRQHGATFSVNTVSLNDLLKRHNAPRQIDYLSIDTEGSELEILSGFDFGAHDVSVITCEHNYTKDRERIFELLIAKGYQRRFTSLSQCDDWYVKQASAIST